MNRLKIIKFINAGIVVGGLLIPLLLFLNRFLIPDLAYDSINYHLFLGLRGMETTNSQYEFYPTGIHNFSSILEVPSYWLMKVGGYRLGAITSLIFLYLSIIVLYKIFRLYRPKYKLLEQWWEGWLLVSCFLSFEIFLQIATYYVDIQVAFWTLLGMYYLLKYEKSKWIIDLVVSSLSLGVLFLGKMTGAYFLVPYCGYLIYILITDKKLNWQKRLERLVISGALILAISLPTFLKNYQATGNPVFPYYNALFKSAFYPTDNFTQQESGGDTLMDKIWWGIVSIGKPEKLGQAHDLFHDYKINIYFILAIVIFIWAVVKKDKQLIKQTIFYLVTYEIWAIVFGYLRYAMVLELWGGLILMLWLTQLKGLKKYLVIGPICLLLLIQNKRIVNLSLAYDISFRPGYFYNRSSYPKEINNLMKNKIEISRELIDKYQPSVYLNCALPNMGYMVMSDFKNLPVMNVEKSVYGVMTDNQLYTKKQAELLKKKVGDKKVRFVTIAAESGFNNYYGDCLANLKNQKLTVLAEESTTFLGYEAQKLKVIFGEFTW